MTNDTFDTLGWDVNGNLLSQSGINFVYDAFDRPVLAGSTQYIYAPDGTRVATVNNTGAIVNMFIPIPMGQAAFNGSTLAYYNRDDWQGSVRVASTPQGGLYSDTSYDAFGIPYFSQGTANPQYAGLTSQVSSGTEQVSETRRYHPTQGRWVSPDLIIPDIFNPQTFNAYHYALNQPTNVTDPNGEDDLFSGLGDIFGFLMQDIVTGICGGSGCAQSGSNDDSFQLYLSIDSRQFVTVMNMVGQMAQEAEADLPAPNKLATDGMVGLNDSSGIIYMGAGFGLGAIDVAVGGSSSGAISSSAIGSIEDAAVEPVGAGRGEALRTLINPTRGTDNCVNCALAVDNTLAGRPTSALPSGPTNLSVLNRYFASRFQPVSGQEGVENILKQSGLGSRGIVFGENPIAGMPGHVFNAVNQGGTVQFLDGQMGRVGASNFDNLKSQSFQFMLTNPGR